MKGVAEQVGTPYYARRDSLGEYTIAGEKYPSVTTILGMQKGEHLLAWAAKQAALKSASHLVQAGVLPIDSLSIDVRHERVLADFCRDLVSRQITPQEAIKEIANWPVVMREYERYRDFKARIGSVAHHAAYEHALHGKRPVRPGQEMDYIRGIIFDLKLCHYDDKGEYAEPTDAMIEQIAGPAEAYVHSVWEWIEFANPEWDAIGQEAVVYRKAFDITFNYGGEDVTMSFPGYAGTMDWIAEFKKSTYQGEWKWDGDRIRMTGDFKTSNSLPDSVRMQTEAYSEADAIILIESGEHLTFDRSDYIGCAHIGPHPQFSGTVTEFGVLDSKTKQVGTTLHSWQKNPVVFAGFLGMCAAYHAGNQDARSIEKQRKPAAPKPPSRTEVRAVPFG